jgi:hypothetical protein
MALIISKIDTTLKIPPYFKGLTGKNWLVIDFKKDEPKDVSDKVAEYYTKSRPKIFRYPDAEEFILYTEAQKAEQPPDEEFDALKFFEDNQDNIENAVNELFERKHLFAICKFMGLTGYVTQDKPRIKERIIADIKIQKEQQEKIGTNS